MAAGYEITVLGHVDEVWSEWLAGLAISHTENGETILWGELVDQAALHGVLIKVRDMGLTLISVERLAPKSKPAHSAQADDNLSEPNP